MGSISGPDRNQTSRTPTTSVATHWNGTVSSSNVRAVSDCSRGGAARGCRGSPRPVGRSPRCSGSQPAGISSLPSRARHRRSRRRAPARVGSSASAGAVDRPDRAAHDQVGADVALDQGPHHPDLERAEVAAAGEHEGDRTVGRAARRVGPSSPSAAHAGWPSVAGYRRSDARLRDLRTSPAKACGCVRWAPWPAPSIRSSIPCGARRASSSAARRCCGWVSDAERGHHRDRQPSGRYGAGAGGCTERSSASRAWALGAPLGPHVSRQPRPASRRRACGA